MPRRKIDLEHEILQKSVRTCGIIFDAPAPVMTDVRMLLKQSPNTQIRFSLVSVEPYVDMKLYCSRRAICLDPEK
jgi:hypothetical protein